ncbi:hypothetical protein FOA52_008106 [Chlamydomonas sp. UWO 241]|nr:hypothetical protein FOA52_008106 [Chlamydomonas sp. UWO 241]
MSRPSHSLVASWYPALVVIALAVAADYVQGGAAGALTRFAVNADNRATIAAAGASVNLLQAIEALGILDCPDGYVPT